MFNWYILVRQENGYFRHIFDIERDKMLIEGEDNKETPIPSRDCKKTLSPAEMRKQRLANSPGYYSFRTKDRPGGI